MTHRRLDTPTWRLIPSRFPPIDTFETAASAQDLEAVLELEGWTNDRLVAERLRRLPEAEWVHGTANASVVMAAFLHAPPFGNRFTGPDLNAWYCALEEVTALAEVAHHLRRQVLDSGLGEMRQRLRAYTALLAGDYLDIRGPLSPDPRLYDPRSYAVSQRFGEACRARGEAGLLYDSVRYAGGSNAVAFRPRNVRQVTQGAHFELQVPAEGRILAIRLS